MHPELTVFHRPTQPLSILLRPTLYAFAVLLALSGCAGTSSPGAVKVESRPIVHKQDSTSRQTEDEDQSTPLIERDFNLERAEYYADVAAQESAAGSGGRTVQSVNPVQIAAILSSAEHYIQAGDYGEAERTLMSIADLPLSAKAQDRFDVVAAYVEYSRGQFVAVLARLQALLTRLPDEEAEISPQVLDALLLAALTHQAQREYGTALDLLLEREQLLSGAARAETSRYIWRVIDALTAYEKQAILAGPISDAVRNRIEQSSLGQVGGQPAPPSQFDQWRADPNREQSQALNAQWHAASPRQVAIILPFSSRFAKAAKALRDGIEHQHNLNENPYRPVLRFYDAGENPFLVTQVYRTAIDSGADFVIGPLGLDYANELTNYALQYADVPTLFLGGDQPLARNIVRLTMSPEWDGMSVADRAYQEGYVTAAIMVPSNDTGLRTANAFKRRWLANGGRISEVMTYSPEQFDHSIELTQLFAINQSVVRHQRLSDALSFRPKFAAYRRADIDFIFMISDNAAGRILRPQINFFSPPNLPVLANPAVYNGAIDRTKNVDLDKTQFPIMPWLIRSATTAAYAGQLNMLFAMGADAYKVAGQYRALRQTPGATLAGDMGQLEIHADGEIRYIMDWAEFVDGEVKPLAPVEPLSDAARRSLHQNRPISDSPGNRNPGSPSTTPQGAQYNDTNWDPRQLRRKTGS